MMGGGGRRVNVRTRASPRRGHVDDMVGRSPFRCHDRGCAVRISASRAQCPECYELARMDFLEEVCEYSFALGKARKLSSHPSPSREVESAFRGREDAPAAGTARETCFRGLRR